MDKNTNKNEMVSIPAGELSQLIYDMNHLALMHKKLIGLYEEESRLKKHHKAYLHIRDYADKVCAADKKTVATIQNRYKIPDCLELKGKDKTKADDEIKMQPDEIFALGYVLMDALLEEIQKK